MRKVRLALEGVNETRIELHAGTPISFADVNAKDELSILQEAQNDSESKLLDISTNNETVFSLEAMSNFIKHTGASGLNKAGITLANVAIEQICSNAKKIAFEEMSMDARAYEANPETVITSGIASIENAKNQLISNVGNDLVSILVNLTTKREAMNKCIEYTYHRIDEVNEAIQRFKNAGVVAGEMSIADGKYAGIYYNNEIVAKGATVVSDINSIMTEHSHVFKRLIKKQLDWIVQHKDNILKTANGFEQYSFNPKEYCVAGSEMTIGGNKAVYKSGLLPGNKAMFFETIEETTFGFAAADALAESKCYIGPVSESSDNSNTQLFKALSIEDIEGRLEELKAGLKNLKMWSDIAYRNLWKDAFFEEEIISFIMKKDAGSLNERGLSSIATGIIGLLNNATVDVGQYALNTFSTLLDYVEDSIASYTVEGAE